MNGCENEKNFSSIDAAAENFHDLMTSDREKLRRHDTQHNDIRHNDTQHNDIRHNDTQHNGLMGDTRHDWHLA